MQGVSKFQLCFTFFFHTQQDTIVDAFSFSYKTDKVIAWREIVKFDMSFSDYISALVIAY